MKSLLSNKKSLALSITLIFMFLFTAMLPLSPDEGMYPLSEIGKIDLQKAGLKIPVSEVYNPNGTSLIDALVNVGGCTGSFISNDGLIITNHHCAFGAVQRASTTEHNYLENGFLADTKQKEIRAQGVACRITESYEDVSPRILKAADEAENISDRMEAISNEIDKIIKEEEAKDTTIRAEVAEMFTGESYVLFRYKMIYDVRLVYVPPRAIGEFGGESDNWVWPRHTGDFSFMRAYVAPDGTPARYSEDNVPYHPKKFLKVNPNGVDEGDFVFILGYPARTYKHQPSQFLVYQEEYQLPYISKLYQWLISLYQKRGENDPEYALKVSSRIKGLANVEKNYRGKIKGLKRLELVAKKQNEEKNLQEYINANPELKDKYGDVLKQIDDVYKEKFAAGRLPLVLSQVSRNVNLYRIADLYLSYLDEMKKPEAERKSFYKKENIKRYISGIYRGYEEDIDKAVMKKIVSDAAAFPEFKAVEAFNRFTSTGDPKDAAEKFVDQLYAESILSEPGKADELFDKSEDEVNRLGDPFIDFVKEMNKAEKEYREEENIRSGKLNILLAKFMDVKRKWLNKSFIPDANFTLRLTYGYIKGYSPADAVYYSPITTLKGVIEKGADAGDYKLPDIIRELYKKKDFGRFKSEKLNDVPVALLYNTDTSGGNSGSPIMNAEGQLIGVNFDRPFEATVNDFAWSDAYSRSIGVDIRYVLWVTQKVGGADFLLKEMGVM